MRKMTEGNAKDAFAGESQAHMKYLNFAEKAAKEGKGNVARLFQAASFSEQRHASQHLKALAGIGKTSENLAAAIAGESFEVHEMYPAYMAVAKEQGEKDAGESFDHAYQAEQAHLKLYQRAKKAVDAGKDLRIGEIWVCGCCGYTMEGKAPDKCPVCGTPKRLFVQF